jgi:hypothetical protein
VCQGKLRYGNTPWNECDSDELTVASLIAFVTQIFSIIKLSDFATGIYLFGVMV